MAVSKQPLKSSHLFVNMFSAALTARLKDPLIRIENLQREGRGSINVFFQLSAHDFGERHITIVTLWASLFQVSVKVENTNYLKLIFFSLDAIWTAQNV